MRRSFLLALLCAAVACAPESIPAAATPAPGYEGGACVPTKPTPNVGLFGGALGVQTAILELGGNQPPFKVLWSNRAASPPIEMTIVATRLDVPGTGVRIRAGWAPTSIGATLPTGRPVTGYVSEIPTLLAGCWQFRWLEGSHEDRIVVDVRAGTGAVPAREPADLLRFPEEQAVLGALAAAGVRVDSIGGSKFETLLGARQRARVFIGTVDGQRVGADVLFLDVALDVHVCAAPGAPGRTLFSIIVTGQPVPGVDAGQDVFFSVGPQHFVQAYDARTSDALRRGLGLTSPVC